MRMKPLMEWTMGLKLPKEEHTSSSWGGAWENERGITPSFLILHTQ